MHVSLFEYQLKDVAEADWARQCADLAPAFAQCPGLLSKVWLHGAGTAFGGVYLWDRDDSYRAFLTSDLGNALRAHPNVAGLTMRDWAVDDVPTAITIGALQP